MPALTPARVAGVVYVVYLVVGLGAGALARGNIAALARGQASAPANAAWLASTVVYGLLVVLLVRLTWAIDARIAAGAIAFGLLGCAIQFGAALLHSGRQGPVAALFAFGIFMILYGWLLTRSALVPGVIGVMFIVSGIGWCSGPVPGLPSQLRLAAQGFGALTEGVLAVWLLVRG